MYNWNLSAFIHDALTNFVLYISRNLLSHLCELNHGQIFCCDQLSDAYIQKTPMNYIFSTCQCTQHFLFSLFFRVFFNRVLALTFFTISTRTVSFLKYAKNYCLVFRSTATISLTFSVKICLIQLKLSLDGFIHFHEVVQYCITHAIKCDRCSRITDSDFN